MCLSVPAEIIEIRDGGATAVAEVGGVRQEIGLTLMDGVQAGDFVLVHAGFAIEKIDALEAEKTLRLLEELAGMEQDPG
jgi:hydrogenase expression/formation protein HypC